MLSDRDFASGEPTTAAEREVHLQNNPENYRVLNRWELENYLYDAEVLKHYCAHNGLMFDDASYSKFVTDIINDNVKDMTGIIKNVPDYVPCAVERHRPSAGANPARQTVAPAGSNRSG